MSKKKLRPLGQTLLDLEPILLEMCIDHDLQWGDVLNIVYGYMEVHVPGAQEQYTAGGNPEFYYGPRRSETKIQTGDNMRSVVHNFKKRPGPKYLAKRRVSFAAVGEVDHVRDNDVVNITVHTANGGTTEFTMEGKEFLSSLVEKTARSSGTKVFILEF